MKDKWNGPIEKINDYTFRVPKSYKTGMHVDGLIYANEQLLKDIINDKALEQVSNVACLPGIQGNSFGMPDLHWGYGFPIGGVAAVDEDQGVISPGGVGYDINCGIRLMRSNLTVDDIKGKEEELLAMLFSKVPAGVGSQGSIRVTASELKDVLTDGAQWAVKNGFGMDSDIDCCEENGKMDGADPSVISDRAIKRGRPQSGTLGSGNHFLEIQKVDTIYDEDIARCFGLEKGQITVMIHTGSRGFGYQVCDDYIKVMINAMRKYNIDLPDRQLSCAPVNSPEGQEYIKAMKCAANFAWANRQCILHLVRECFSVFFGDSVSSLGLSLVYDIAHNIAKYEPHVIDGKEKNLWVHRKGATRTFGPGRKEIPTRYRDVGQPVIIPGDMGSHSYVLAGTEKAMSQTFGSTCHGAGRLKSRHQAIKSFDLNRVLSKLKQQGIIVMATGKKTILEEAPGAYKNIDSVVDVVHNVGISKRIARMTPIAVIKG